MNRSCKLFAVILSCAVAAVTFSGCNTVKLGNTSYDKTVSGLNLNGKGLTNTDIANIGKFENVTYLDLRGNFITDLSFLSDMTGLQQLYVDYSQIENNTHVFNSLYMLKEMEISISEENISNSDGIADTLCEIMDKYPFVKTEPDISEFMTVELGGGVYSRDITELDLNGQNLTNNDIENIIKLKKVSYLDVRGNSITDWSFLKEMTDLQRIDIEYVQIKNNIDSFKGLNKLNKMTISIPSVVTEDIFNEKGIEIYDDIIKIIQVYPFVETNPDISDLVQDFSEFGAKSLKIGADIITKKCERYGCSICPGVYFGRIEKSNGEYEYGEDRLPIPKEEINNYDWAQRYVREFLYIQMNGNEDSNEYYFLKFDDNGQSEIALWSYWDFIGNNNISEIKSSNGRINGYVVGFYPDEETFNIAICR